MAVDKEVAKEMVQKSKQMSVPVIIVGDEVFVGFNQTRLESVLS